MRYEVKADVGGKLAQLGGRLIDSTAKKLADEFFERFTAIVGGTSPARRHRREKSWCAACSPGSAKKTTLALSGPLPLVGWGPGWG